MGNSLNFGASIYANALNKPNSYKYVYDIAGKYNKWSTIIDAWNQKAAEAYEGTYNTGDNKYEFAVEDTYWVVESITGNSLVGVNLTVNYSGTNDFFRNKQTVVDDSFGAVIGQVISHAPGTVTLAPVNVAFVAATMFTAGMYIREFANASGFRASQGMESLYTIPTKDYDYAQTFRESCFLAASDAQSTYVSYNGKDWGHRQVDKAIERNAIARERQSVLGTRTSFNSPIDGQTYTSTSLKWACQNRGGQYVPITGALPFATFNNILMNQKIKKATNGDSHKIILCGAGFLSYFQQNYVNNFVQYAGNRNTFGGESVQGLSVNFYSIGGVLYDLVELPLFNDPNWSNVPTAIAGLNGSRLSNSFFVIDPDMIPTVGSGPNRAPVQKIYWGQKGMNAKVISGMIGADLTMDNNMSSQGMFQNTGSPVDGMQIEVMEKCGDHIASGKGISFVEVVA